MDSGVNFIETCRIEDLPQPFSRGKLKVIIALGADLEVGIQVFGEDRLVALIAFDP